MRLDPKKLYDRWLQARPEAVRFFADDQAEAYRTLLRAIAAALCAIAEKLPRFQAATAKEWLEALDGLARQGEEIKAVVERAVQNLDAVRTDVAQLRQSDDERLRRVSRHEADYRHALRDEASKLRLFGVDYDPAIPKEWPLDIAYVPLRLDLGHHGERLGYEPCWRSCRSSVADC